MTLVAVAPSPTGCDIVLVGGGHAHVQVMTAFARAPTLGLRLTLVSDRAATPYSGMLPGHIAGLYARDDIHIDLVRLARATDVRLILTPAAGLDRAARTVLFADRPPLPYDLVSFDVGVTPDLTTIAGAAEHGLAVKPIAGLLDRLEALLAAVRAPDGPRRLTVVGAGAAGVELAIALRLRLDREANRAGRDPADVAVALVGAGELAPALNAGARRRVAAALRRAGVAFHADFRVMAVEPGAVIAADGRRLPGDAALFATAARAPGWLAATGLPCAPDGSLFTDASLRVMGESAVFAVGDCALNVDAPRPKAGVFAVRQGPVLAENLRRAALGGPLRPWRAQKNFLTLLLSGDRTAIAARGGRFSAEGALVWRWKDHIDRAFMTRFATREGGREGA